MRGVSLLAGCVLLGALGTYGLNGSDASYLAQINAALDMWRSSPTPYVAESQLDEALRNEQAFLQHFSQSIEGCWLRFLSGSPERELSDEEIIQGLKCEVSAPGARNWLRMYPRSTDKLKQARNITLWPLSDPQYYFDRGVEAFRRGDNERAVGLFEAVLALAQEEVVRCFAAAQCYEPLLPNQPMGPDTVVHSSDLAFMIACRAECVLANDEAILDLSVHRLLVATIDHLQFAYYKIKDMPAAARCAEAGIAVNPSNGDLKRNLDHFGRNHKTVHATQCTHVREITRGNALLWQALKRLPAGPQTDAAARVRATLAPADCTDRRVSCPVWHAADACAAHALWMHPRCPASCGLCRSAPASTAALPHEAVVIDGIATAEECAAILALSQFTIPGDGYDGRTTPFSSSETFAGLTPAAAAKLAARVPSTAAAVSLYQALSNRVLARVTQALNLTNLFFQYTHLVVRTATSPASGMLSHPIHGDNCHNKDGKCVRAPPAFVARDYSAVLFLNSDFKGGEFFFTSDYGGANSVFVPPRCGRLVAFNASQLHGVLPLQPPGRRVALAYWFTLDESAQQHLGEAFSSV